MCLGILCFGAGFQNLLCRELCSLAVHKRPAFLNCSEESRLAVQCQVTSEI